MPLSNFILPTASDDGDRHLLHSVVTTGWHGIHIPAEGNLPRHSFTVGLYYTHGHPEIMVMGLVPELSYSLFSTVLELIKDHRELQAGTVTQDLFQRNRCLVAAVPLTFYTEYLGYAQWFYHGRPFPALQIVWPDRNDHLPGESGYDERLLTQQVVLADLPAWPFPGSPPDQAAFTRKAVLEGEWISLVSHDEKDGSWQFHCSGPAPTAEEGRVVSLASMLQWDSTLAWLGYIPPGWCAWREAPDKPWQRGPQPQ